MRQNRVGSFMSADGAGAEGTLGEVATTAWQLGKEGQHGSGTAPVSAVVRRKIAADTAGVVARMRGQQAKRAA